MRLITDRGFAARSSESELGLKDTLVELGATDPAVVEDRGLEIGTWGVPEWRPGHHELLLAASVRRHDHDLPPAEVGRMQRRGSQELAHVLPAFAAAVSTDSGVSVSTDYLGFRHVFHGRTGSTGIVSTSSRACALELRAGLDLEGVGVQSVLGWQLGQRTLFEGVRKLGPGEIATVENGDVAVSDYRPPAVRGPIDLDRAVDEAAQILRAYLAAYLEDHPDAGLQLTGGQDSRLLLSAVPPAMRRGLRVVTLGTRGDPDVDTAAEFATRFGMRHEILNFDGLDAVSPADAFRLCLDAARRLDYSADPIAHAALTYAESRSEHGPRISGLGGEVARGFYYLGPPTDSDVTARRAQRLARWRMFVNESVPAEALDPTFASWARDFAMHEVVRVLTETGRPWMDATDDLYLGQRMQRWGGVTETAVCLEREIVNPMLDDRFISIAQALSPRHKRNSRFLSRLQLELDPELGAHPLDGRPPPAAYAHRSARNSARMTTATLRKARHKVVQRVRRQNRPPAGGDLVAQKVVAHWREDSATLQPLRALDVFSEDWLDAVVSGEAAPSTSAVALMVNLIGATQSS